MKTLLTAAGSATVRVVEPPLTFVSNVSGSDTVDVQINLTDNDYIDIHTDGEQVQLTATNNMVAVYAPGKYKVTTTATCTVSAITNDRI